MVQSLHSKCTLEPRGLVSSGRARPGTWLRLLQACPSCDEISLDCALVLMSRIEDSIKSAAYAQRGRLKVVLSALPWQLGPFLLHQVHLCRGLPHSLWFRTGGAVLPG